MMSKSKLEWMEKNRGPEVILRLLGSESSNCTVDLSNTVHAKGNSKSPFHSFHRKLFTNYYPMKKVTKNKKK